MVRNSTFGAFNCFYKHVCHNNINHKITIVRSGSYSVSCSEYKLLNCLALALVNMAQIHLGCASEYLCYIHLCRARWFYTKNRGQDFTFLKLLWNFVKFLSNLARLVLQLLTTLLYFQKKVVQFGYVQFWLIGLSSDVCTRSCESRQSWQCENVKEKSQSLCRRRHWYR